MPLKTRCRGLGRCVCVRLHRINGAPGPGGRALGAAGTVRALRARPRGAKAPPPARVCWGELCPVPTPPLRHPPALGREVFVAPLRHRPRAAPGSARGGFGERSGPDGGEAKSRRASSGAFWARRGAGSAGRRPRARAGLWRPRHPQPARTGPAAPRPAERGRPWRKLFMYSAVLFVASAPRAMFSSLLRRNVRLVC